MTMMLVFACIFLGMQMLFPRKEPDPRTYTDVLKQLRELESQQKDVDAAALLPVYQQKLNDAKNKDKWAQDVFDQRELEGIMLVAHAKFLGADSRSNMPEKAA